MPDPGLSLVTETLPRAELWRRIQARRDTMWIVRIAPCGKCWALEGFAPGWGDTAPCRRWQALYLGMN